MLAAYVDGALEPDTHAEVQEHLAACETCFELVTETYRAVLAGEADQGGSTTKAPASEGAPAEPATPRAARVLPFSRRTVVATAASVLTLAAALVLVVRIQPAWWGGGAERRIAALAEAAHGERTIDARPSGFLYGPLRSPMRSAASRDRVSLALLAAAQSAEEAARARPTPENLHAWGLGQLLIGETDGAVRTLEQVASSRPTDSRLHNDLAAAYLARGQREGRPADLTKAVESAERALRLDATRLEAWFNKAVALEALGQREAAMAAWREVISRDQSAWRGEAERRLRELEALGSTSLGPACGLLDAQVSCVRHL